MHPLGTGLPLQQWWHLLPTADCGNDGEWQGLKVSGIAAATRSHISHSRETSCRVGGHRSTPWRVPATAKHISSQTREPSWKWSSSSRQVLGWPEPWLMSSSKLISGLEMEQGHSLIPDPQKLWEVINAYCTSLVSKMIKNLPATQETWVLPLEKRMSVHSSVLAWRIPCREEPGRLQSIGWQRVGQDWASNTYAAMGNTWRGSSS